MRRKRKQPIPKVGAQTSLDDTKDTSERPPCYTTKATGKQVLSIRPCDEHDGAAYAPETLLTSSAQHVHPAGGGWVIPGIARERRAPVRAGSPLSLHSPTTRRTHRSSKNQAGSVTPTLGKSGEGCLANQTQHTLT